MSDLEENPALSVRLTPHLLGQAAAEADFLAAEASGRLPHAWLLSGPRGVGKATLAYRMARFMLAGGSQTEEEGGLFGDALPPVEATLEMDEEHSVFRRVAAGGHLDLRVLKREFNSKTKKLKTEISVDDVRSCIEFLRKTSVDGGWRVVIVDSADDMNRSSANALLKVLEEPPAGALLILVSHSPGRLLPTIRSRCRGLALSPLPLETVEELLQQQLPELPAEDCRALARLSEGSIGRARELAESGGLDLYRDLLALLSQMPNLDIRKLHEFGDRMSRDNSGMVFRTTSDLLTWWIARLVRHSASGSQALEIVEGEGALMARLIEQRGLAPWLALWENLTQLFARAEASALDRKQVMVSAFLDMESLAA
ncbi:DNA polymerase III subunit delta' [Rhodovibrionaceae bacterium A322]